MGHGHRHDHRTGAATSGVIGHRSGDGTTADGGYRVFWALLITASFRVAEVAGGIISGSLALLANAGRMLTDAAALGLSWYAFRMSRPSTPKHSFGQHRFQVLAASTAPR